VPSSRDAYAAELVRLTPNGHSFFTYVSDDPPTFPRTVTAIDANGDPVSTQDVSEDIMPPKL
jgi:hypothetical protein